MGITRRICFIINCLTCTYICHASCNITQQQQISALFNLMATRASYMKNVAAHKYNESNSNNIFDAKQEGRVLGNSATIAKQYGLNAFSVMQFIQIQMDISKLIEFYWYQQWNNKIVAKPDVNNILSLDNLRTQIKETDNKIFTIIKPTLPIISTCDRATVDNLFAQSFQSVIGIPDKPDYKGLLEYSVTNIKIAQ